MSKPSRWLAGLLLLAGAGASAQEPPNRTAILATVDSFFTGVRTGDTALLARVIDSQAAAVGVTYQAGTPTVVGLDLRAAVAGLAAVADRPDEGLLAAEVWQDGDIAMVWGPNEARRGGTVVNCGFDSFDLIRRAGRWTITNVAFTDRPDGCPAAHAAADGPRPLPPPSAAERAQVMAALDSFFVALRERDTALLGRAVSPRATWTTAAYRNGTVILGRRPASQDGAILTRAAEPLHERLIDAVVRVDGDLALVWGPYRFHVGERLSHCGHDGFRLVREDGRWRLDGGLYTVRPDGCLKFISPRDVDSLPSAKPDAVVPYGPDPRQVGELRLPRGAGPFPVAVVIHGGCWQRVFASARNTAALADALRDRGIATWNVEYRTADEPGGGWPGTFLDASDATDFVRTLARRYPLDTTRVVVVGHSAGGHLALWLAGRARLPAASQLRRLNPLAVKGGVALGPVMDLVEAGERITGRCGQGVTWLVGGTPTEVADRYREASPIDLLPLGVPHAIMMGELDGIMPARPREEYVRKARLLGDAVSLVVVPNSGHGELTAPTSAAWPAVLEQIEALIPR